MTGRAGAEGIVEREQARLRVLIGDAAALALEPLAEHMACQRTAIVASDLEGERGAALCVRGLDRVCEPRAEIAVDLHAIHDDRQHGPAGHGRAIEIFERDGAIVDEHAPEPALRKALERRAHRIDGAGPLAAPPVRRAERQPLSADSGVSPRPDRPESPRAPPRWASRSRSAGESPRQAVQPARNDLCCFAQHLLPALAADRPADARPEQPHVVVDLGRGANSRPRVADGVLLADGDGRADALDPLDIRLLHPLEELPRVAESDST